MLFRSYKLGERAVVTDRADGGGGAPVREGARRGKERASGITAMLWGKVALSGMLCIVVAACASVCPVGGQWRGGVDSYGG